MKRKMIRMEVLPSSDHMPWKVTVSGVIQVYCFTQKAGLVWARQYVKERLHAGIAFTLKIKGEDGKIKREHTYPRIADPKNTKG